MSIYIFENMHNDSLTLVIFDQELVKDDQVQESGNVEGCCLIKSNYRSGDK